jgi:hypothetical protein
MEKIFDCKIIIKKAYIWNLDDEVVELLKNPSVEKQG